MAGEKRVAGEKRRGGEEGREREKEEKEIIGPEDETKMQREEGERKVGRYCEVGKRSIQSETEKQKGM